MRESADALRSDQMDTLYLSRISDMDTVKKMKLLESLGDSFATPPVSVTSSCSGPADAEGEPGLPEEGRPAPRELRQHQNPPLSQS